MKKSHIMLAVLSALFGAAGYGAGHFLVPESAQQQVKAPPRTGSEQVLDKLSQDDTGQAPAAVPPREHAGAPADGPAGAAADTSTGTDAAQKPAALRRGEKEVRLLPAALKLPASEAGAAADPSADPAAAAPGFNQREAPKILRDNAARQATRMDQPPTSGVATAKDLADKKVVQLGRMTVPVQRANSITYVISDIGVAVKDSETAQYFNTAENAARLRDAILMQLHRVSGTSMLRKASIDTEALSQNLASELKSGFGDSVESVLFMSLYKADVPRS
ncbi:hypothetical protein [Brevirhabdus sp.]|uniref:hypothetical protein n=1 Tax=Brevirhabdus sp. TaxID=2004514 RepID=UPI0040591FB9